MNIEGYNFPDDLYFHKEHTWARKEGTIIVIGVTDYAQKMAGTVKRVQTLEEDDEVEQHKPFGTMSTGKWTGKLYSPVSGEIATVNEDLDGEPGSINSEPYGAGWLIKVKLGNEGELAALMRVGTPDFAAWFKAERAKHQK